MELLLGVIALSTALVVPLALFFWGRRVAKKHPQVAGYQVVSWFPLAAIAVGGTGIVLTVVKLVGTFRVLGSVPASEKSALLSTGIAEAMTSTAWTAPIALLAMLVSFVVFLTGSARPASR